MHIRQYEVLKELGRGQFGEVVLAVGEVPGRNGGPGRRRLVAIKSLRERRNAESARLLKQEFALLDQVKHRSIVRVFEYMESERSVVMEYVHGVTLRTVLDDCAKAREQVFTEAAIEIGCEVADALYQAWTSPGDNGDKLRLVHRDLKPENIMLTPDGDLKVLDFGLARVDNADFAREDPSRIRGTPIYMAPEQARGEEIDHRADLFSLGLILYELLMNRPAHRAPQDAADPIRAAFASIEAGALNEQCRELEAKLPGMGPVVARLLQANPRNRYPNGQDLLVDLRRQLYKDRGSYIKEFVSFYFGSLRPIGAPPDPDAPPGARMSTEKRKSMEERLAESLDGDPGDPAPRAPVPVRRAPRATPVDIPPPSRAPVPSAAPSIAPRASAPPKITPRAAATKTAPILEDDDLPVSVRGAKSPPPGVRPPEKKPIGSRSPTEAGMLQMVPIGNADEAEAQADPSATAFFAIPAPKSERPKAAATPAPGPASAAFQPPPTGARMPSQPQFVPPTPGVGQPGMGGQPMGGQSMGGQSMGGQSIGIGMGGAQSGGGVHGGGGGTPFQVSGSQPTQGSADESRMQSTRVFALVFVALAILCFAVVLAGVAVWWKLAHDDKAPDPAVEVAVAAVPKKATVDTAAQEAPKATTAVKKTTKTTGGGTAPAPTPKASATGTVTVSFGGATVPGSVEVSCGGGFRERKTVSGGSAAIPGVPTSGDCKLYPKGGVVASSVAVRGGASYSCTITGTTTKCN